MNATEMACCQDKAPFGAQSKEKRVVVGVGAIDHRQGKEDASRQSRIITSLFS
jgi:hypothetical protein